MRVAALLMCVAAGCSPAPETTVSNSECASCHPSQSAALAASRHAHAEDSDLFRALRAAAPAVDQSFCDSCHAAHDVPGELGAGCVTCHSASGDRGVLNAALVYDQGTTVSGPINNPVPTPAHASNGGGFVLSADLCGTCHQVAGPGAFIETPYTEWAASADAHNGITCASCHMSVAPGDSTAAQPTGQAATGGPTRPLSDHGFIGPDDPRAPELLARAAGITARVTATTDSALMVTATVTNRNAAHDLPSGARFAREVWLVVTASDASGVDHTVSGGTDAMGLPLAGDTQRVYLADLLTHAGAFALPFASDPPVVRAIAAGASAFYTYTVPASWTPGGATVGVTITLRYRRNAAALRAALGLPPDTVSPVDLATTTITVP